MKSLPLIDNQPQVTPVSEAEKEVLQQEIRQLAGEKETVILAHNYQLPEVQQVADYVSDSLQLARQAAATDAETIAFCGVHFMAETAAILSPEKKVWLPDLKAGCSLADSIDAKSLLAWKDKYPGAIVVMYVNTSAEVKALTDYCCTSSNAVQIVEHIWRENPDAEIIFGPDMWLGSFVARKLGLQDDPQRYARFHVYDGECHVHAGIRPNDITAMREQHPQADFLIHPECGCSTQALEYVASGDIASEGVKILSTSQMIAAVEAEPEKEYIIATENGMLFPLQQAAPQAKLIEANRMAYCKYMKMIDLPKLKNTLLNEEFLVTVDKEIAAAAEQAIQRMVSIG